MVFRETYRKGHRQYLYERESIRPSLTDALTPTVRLSVNHIVSIQSP